MRYKLPESLGGVEYDAVPGGGELSKDGLHVAFDLPDLDHIVWLPKWILTPVKPPLPEEPPPLAVILDCDGKAWQNTGGYRGPWECTHDDAGTDWDTLVHDHNPLTRLVPDPFAEPVDLTDAGVSLDLHCGEVRLGQACYKPSRAREIALALMAAADAAEKEQS